MSLRRGLGSESADKQVPSALEMLASFRMAVDVLKRGARSNMPLRDALSSCVTTFNKTVARKYAISGSRKKMILNLMKAPEDFVIVVRNHYDQHKHSCSGHL